MVKVMRSLILFFAAVSLWAAVLSCAVSSDPDPVVIFTYAVTYNANNATSGSVPIDANQYPAGSKVTLKANTGSLVKTDSTFVGWNTKSDGTGTNYSADSTMTMGAASLILYACWTTLPTYTVSYNANGATGGTVPDDSNAYLAAAAVLLKANTGNLVKTGYSFVGWNTATDGTGTSYSAGGTMPMGSANVILYARWSNTPTSVSISSFTSSASSSWQNVAIGGGGYVTGLVFLPTAANVLYARTDIGGAYRWDSASSAWIPLQDQLTRGTYGDYGIESLALDPTDANKVYMMTGMYVGDSSYSWYGSDAKFWASADKGSSWTVTTLNTGSSSSGLKAGSNNTGRGMGERLVVDPNKPSILFFASRTAGLWKSTSSGSSWAQVSSSTFPAQSSWTGDSVGLTNVVFDSGTTGSGSATQTIYVTADPSVYSSNLFKSTDGGTSWTAVSTPSTYAAYYIHHMVRAASGKFYLVFNSAKGPGGSTSGAVYQFDGSATWTLRKSSTSYGYHGLSVSAGDSAKLVVSTGNTWGSNTGSWTADTVFRSSDSGATWTAIGSGTHTTGGIDYLYWGGSVPTHWGWLEDIEIDPSDANHVLYVTGSGIWGTSAAFSSSSPTWTPAVTGLEETACLALKAAPSLASYSLVSGQGDIGGFVHTSLTSSPAKANCTVQYFKNVCGLDMAWKKPATIVEVGAKGSSLVGVYSTDSGSSWSSFATTPAGASSKNNGENATVAVTADAGTIIWSIPGVTAYYSTGKGASWTATNLPAAATDCTYHLAADRVNALKVYAYAYSTGKLYYSTDAGHTFTASSVSLSTSSSYFATNLVANPFVEGDVWVSDGSTKLYHSVNSGSTWVTVTVAGAYGVTIGLGATDSPAGYAVYLYGKVGSTEGIFRSDDAGATWARINDDAHRFGGVNRMAASCSTYGQVFLGLGGRGVVYNTP